MLLYVCPWYVHVHSEIVVEHDDKFADHIHVIGTRLRRLKLNYELGTAQRVPLDVLPAFGNIKTLFLILSDEWYTEEFLRVVESIFAKPMPKLCD